MHEVDPELTLGFVACPDSRDNRTDSSVSAKGSAPGECLTFPCGPPTIGSPVIGCGDVQEFKWDRLHRPSLDDFLTSWKHKDTHPPIDFELFMRLGLDGFGEQNRMVKEVNVDFSITFIQNTFIDHFAHFFSQP